MKVEKKRNKNRKTFLTYKVFEDSCIILFILALIDILYKFSPDVITMSTGSK